MQTSEHQAIKQAIKLRLAIHKAAAKILGNDYDATSLTDEVMTLILDWSDPKYDDYLIKPEVPTHEL